MARRRRVAGTDPVLAALEAGAARRAAVRTATSAGPTATGGAAPAPAPAFVPVTTLEAVVAEMIGLDLPGAPPVARAPMDALARAVGPEAGAVLAAHEVADLDDVALDEALLASRRLASWAAAKEAQVIAEKQRRAGSRHEFVRDEVAALLTLTGWSAEVLTVRAQRLTSLPALHDALAAGRLDARRVDTLLNETDHLDPGAASAIVADVVERAPGLTTTQLRDAVRKAELARDPAAVDARQRKERKRRCVKLEHLPDAMARLVAYLPAADAMTVWNAVDALAQQREPGDERKLDERRADVLTAVMRRVLDTGVAPDGTPVPGGRARRPHLSVVAGPWLLGPGAQGVAELEGYGPIPPSVAREIAAQADWQVVGVDPRTGEASGQVSRTFRPTVGAGLTSGAGPAAGAGPASGAGPAAGAGPTSGAGPAAGGAAFGLGERASCGYRPSERLRAAVVARDRTCTFPGCRRPARWCDLDHIVPFDPDRPAAEQTCYDNLHALCRRHHRLKTHGRWTVSRDPRTGITTWISPAGRVFRRHPELFDPSGSEVVDPDDDVGPGWQDDSHG